MIARITGTLLELNTDAHSVLLEVADIAYEILVPGYALSDLSILLHRTVTLHCLQYLEAGTMGANMFPRIIGFPHAQDKAFFQRFTSVKGIGTRKALKALAQAPSAIAAAIEAGDARALAQLPEIGKRTAEQIVAELKGKMESYALGALAVEPKDKQHWGETEREALEILLQLGEKRHEAEEWIARIREEQPAGSTDELVQAVYRLKAGMI